MGAGGRRVSGQEGEKKEGEEYTCWGGENQRWALDLELNLVCFAFEASASTLIALLPLLGEMNALPSPLSRVGI